MFTIGIEDPVVRFYRIEYAKEYANLPYCALPVSASMVRQRLGLPPRPSITCRLCSTVMAFLKGVFRVG